MKRYSAPAKKVLGVGNALLDTLIRIPDDGLLAPMGLSKGHMTLVDESQCRRIIQRTENLERREEVGGSAANTIRAIAHLGQPAGYIGKVGEDAAGRSFQGDMERHRVESQLLTDGHPTGRCISLISPDSERTMATFLGAAAEMTAEEITPALFSSYEYLLIEGYLAQNHKMIERALSLAKAAGLCVALDLSSPNIVAGDLVFFRGITSQWVDIILANEEEALAFTGMPSARDALPVLTSYCKIAVLKLGHKGSIVSYQNTRYFIPIAPVEAVDTTGAGDLYAAGFLYGLARGLGLQTCGKIAALLASHVVGVVGAAIPEKQWPEIRAAVRKLES